MSAPVMRCGIYTRKSSDEGLDQDFNSLDAQYEACASYIASQRHEGWKLVRNRYDDGGISGGTLERPALKRLMDDIEAGRIQMVVVYKIDRLTRSLADFAKLVERLEASGCSFVSVTQAFNTSSSMGRLTLNVLLSFAQFEREVTAERIRDKISASKQKGLWMGGKYPLGYDKHPDPQKRTLVVNETEAETVKALFGLYRNIGCLRAVEEEALRLGLRSKQQTFANGREARARPLSRGQIYYILRNPLYIGEIRHKDKTYPGQHPPIITPDLWANVQAKLQSASRRKRGDGKKQTPASFLLTGKISDDRGDPLTPTSTRKGKRTHRYYVSNRLISGGKDPAAWRLPANHLENSIASIIADHLSLSLTVAELFDGLGVQQITALQDRLKELAKSIQTDERHIISGLVAHVRVEPEQVHVCLDQGYLAERLDVEIREINPAGLSFIVPWHIKRRGIESKLILGDEKPVPDLTLIKLLAQAHKWAEEMRCGTPLKKVAERTGVTPAYIRTRVKLALLSPKIQKAIFEGELDPKFTTNRILTSKIPLDWGAQETLFLQ
ncbi:MAG: recombinase family protein [Rhodospirillales bacterium]